MRSSITLALAIHAIDSLALAQSACNVCIADSCLNAVGALGFGSAIPRTRLVDCSSFLAMTAAPATSTVTSYVTSTSIPGAQNSVVFVTVTETLPLQTATRIATATVTSTETDIFESTLSLTETPRPETETSTSIIFASTETATIDEISSVTATPAPETFTQTSIRVGETRTDVLSSVVSTQTVTVTTLSVAPQLSVRDVAVSTSIPAYANACLGAAEYASACSCFGASAATYTETAQTATETIISTITVTAATNIEFSTTETTEPAATSTVDLETIVTDATTLSVDVTRTFSTTLSALTTTVEADITATASTQVTLTQTVTQTLSPQTVTTELDVISTAIATSVLSETSTTTTTTYTSAPTLPLIQVFKLSFTYNSQTVYAFNKIYNGNPYITWSTDPTLAVVYTLNSAGQLSIPTGEILAVDTAIDSGNSANFITQFLASARVSSTNQITCKTVTNANAVTATFTCAYKARTQFSLVVNTLGNVVYMNNPNLAGSGVKIPSMTAIGV